MTRKTSFAALVGSAILGIGLTGIPSARHTSAQQRPAPLPDPNVALRFDVASVKPNKSGRESGNLRRQAGGLVIAVNMRLSSLITYAYQATPLTLVGGPSWINDERFDLTAKLPGDLPPVTPGSFGTDYTAFAMRTLLAERFNLKVHREPREQDVYALVMARVGGNPGPSLKRSTQDCSPETLRTMIGRGGLPIGPGAPIVCNVVTMPGRMQANGEPLAAMTNPLSSVLGRIVVDRTGLTGAWDFELTFAPDSGAGLASPVDALPADPNLPSIFTALQEQLGLKLEAARAPVEVLVIDRVERLTPD
jgi:uncharacterized protein (TIGR03435 family)